MIDISEDTFDVEGTDLESIMNTFVCIICYGVSINPVKCDGCQTVYCKTCLPADAFNKHAKPDKKSSYCSKKYTCHKMCGFKTVSELGRIEKNILNSLAFKCQHADDGCKEIILYSNLKKHLSEDCVVKIEFPPEPKPVFVKNQDPIIIDQLNVIQQANLANLFAEEGDEVEQEVAWRFEQVAVAAPQAPVPEPPRVQHEDSEESDVDMGNLFGDDDDY